MTKGSLTVISGFSGAGKGTIMKRLLEKYPQYVESVSCTTRQPRPGEVDGKSYYFISQEEFDRRVANDELLEHAGYVGHSYGTPKRFVEEQIAAGRDVILEIEAQGAAIVKQKMPEAIMLFVTTESADILKDRLIGRGTESMELVQKRLARACEECRLMEHYDALIVNRTGCLEEAVDEVHAAIQSFKTTPGREHGFIEQLEHELDAINKNYKG
ncbi:guanylate kinase [Lachnospiraceae bacterium NK3A20]|nr:guanylate kinase [Lachnospiraceae bacterium NK3A20]